VVTLPSGLQYKVLRKGAGGFHPKVNSPCECHYKGTLIDGTQFDSSYDRGEPTTFAPNQVIKGWTEAMQLMVEGDKWELYVPAELGYGARGSPPKIPPGATLVFTIEILHIKGDKKPAVACEPVSGESCSEKELAFIAKVKAMGATEVESQVERLSQMREQPMKEHLLHWVHQRLKILGAKDEL